MSQCRISGSLSLFCSLQLGDTWGGGQIDVTISYPLVIVDSYGIIIVSMAGACLLPKATGSCYHGDMEAESAQLGLPTGRFPTRLDQSHAGYGFGDEAFA